MKLPSCLCGLLRGFHHDLVCCSCSCFPWQHSSDESEEESSSEDEYKANRRQVQEEREAIRLERIRDVEYALKDGEFDEKVYNGRYERELDQCEERIKIKKKKMKTRRELDNNRLVIPSFTTKKYALNAYNYYADKENYEMKTLSDYFKYLKLESQSTARRFLNAELSLSELGLQSYEDMVKEKELEAVLNNDE